jgi:hypothetical protein
MATYLGHADYTGSLKPYITPSYSSRNLLEVQQNFFFKIKIAKTSEMQRK